MVRSTPRSASTTPRPFWYCLVTPVSLYIRSLPGWPWRPQCRMGQLVRGRSFDPRQGHGRPQPGRAPAAEGAGDQAAGDRQDNGRDDRSCGYLGDQRDTDVRGGRRGRAPEAEATAAAATSGTAEATTATAEAATAEGSRPARCGVAGRLPDRGRQRLGEVGDQRGSEEPKADAHNAAGDPDDNRLADHLPHDPAAGPAECLERAELAHPPGHRGHG